MAGVSFVGVAPTHRRRGILRTVMAAVVDQAIERGEPLAGLTASEGAIYRRFGFGVGAHFQSIAVDCARSSELVGTRAPGRVRLVDEDKAATMLPGVWNRHWRRSPGELDRTPGWWRSMALDPEHEREGASARYVTVHEDAGGTPDGFTVHRIKRNWGDDGVPRHELWVEDLAAADDAVEAALLRYLLDVDLVASLRWYAPVDLPLRWRLADPRAVAVGGERDHLWLRPLEVARCLAARRYATEGRLVIEVVDDDRPELGGRFRLDAGPDGAEAIRTTDQADLSLALPDLGATLLGGVSWSTLRRAGLVEEHRPGATVRADALFRPDRAPYCATDF